VSTHGRMEDNTVENTKMTRSMDLEFTPGLMVVCIPDTGAVVNSMVLEITAFHNNHQSVDYGKKASELNGLMKTNKEKLKRISSTTKCTLEKQKVDLPLTRLLRSIYQTNLMQECRRLLTSLVAARLDIEQARIDQTL